MFKVDGTLRIKGKKHMEWFKEHIGNVLAHGSKELAAATDIGGVIDLHLRLEDGYTVSRQITQLITVIQLLDESKYM
jgi:hypothetical protein